MSEQAKADVAMVAQEATDKSCAFDVVEMEITFSVGGISSADRAASLLFGKQLAIRSQRDAVSRFELVVFGQSRVRFAPLFRVQRSAFKVFLAPFFMAFEVALAAIDRVAVKGVVRFSEISKRFGLLAFRTAFDTRGRIEGFAWHVSTF